LAAGQRDGDERAEQPSAASHEAPPNETQLMQKFSTGVGCVEAWTAR
jgi:hypothetical protein